MASGEPFFVVSLFKVVWLSLLKRTQASKMSQILEYASFHTSFCSEELCHCSRCDEDSGVSMVSVFLLGLKHTHVSNSESS